MAAEFFLHVDGRREDAVLPFLRALIPEQMLRVKTMQRGDYAIVDTSDVIWAVLERKAHNDYGASISDGRTANKQKMLELRQPGSALPHVYYLIEGPMNPAPGSMFGGKPWSTIESSIFHLMTEYGIMIIQTASPMETARKLALLMKSYAVRPPRAVGAAEISDAPLDLASRFEIALDEPVAGRSASAAMLYTAAQKQAADLRVELWMAVDGFGKTTALAFAAHPAWQILSREVSLPLKTQKQLEALTELRASRWNKTQEKFLRGVHGIGSTSATRLMERASCFAELFERRAELLSQADVKKLEASLL